MEATLRHQVLVTGGAGYIGTHTVIELLNAGHDVVIVDSLVNSSKEAISRVGEITGKVVQFYELDLLNEAELDKVFTKHSFTSVIHFAGLKAVGESTRLPLLYYNNNITGTIVLLKVMAKHNVKNLIFSSSATVYGDPDYLPIDENHPVGRCTNPYGKTKYFIEEICRDMTTSDPNWNIVLLRYFNPIGAHKSGRIGEDPKGQPNNLLPYIAQVAVGRLPELNVFGDDYNTEDGTGVRDYIHVVDLALGHVAALKRLDENCSCAVYNLGTGKPASVLQMITAFQSASGKEIPYKISPRRDGDIASCYADASKAAEELGWKATRSIEEGCEDGWRWQSLNPLGYQSRD